MNRAKSPLYDARGNGRCIGMGMFAGARIIVATAIPAALTLALSACDGSRHTPETVSASVPGAAAAGAGHERSIRLYGPGVSRQRQTRI